MQPKRITPAQYVILKRKGKTQGKNFIVTAKATPAATKRPPARLQTAKPKQIPVKAWIQIKQAPKPAQPVKQAARIQTPPAVLVRPIQAATPAAIQDVKQAAKNLSTEVEKVVTSFDTSKINQSINTEQAADISAQLDQQEPAAMDKKKMILIGTAAAAAIAAFLILRKKK
jgi:hypothetical protein